VTAPGPLRRADVALDRAFRRLGRLAGSPLSGLSRWERGDRGPLVRTIVARPGLVAICAGLVLVLGSGVHLARFPAEPRPDTTATDAPDEVGPPTGTDIERYAARRHELLLALDGAQASEQLRAVVSFEELVTLGSLPLPEQVQVERVQLLLPGELEPRELPADGAEDDLATVLSEGREELDREIAELEQLLAEDLGDPDFEAEFTTQLERLVELRDRASAEAPVVFAAVVVAPAVVLQELLGVPGIRIVDPAGSAELTRGTRMVGVPPRAAEAGAPLGGADEGTSEAPPP
jgi:hypothetical protein